MKTLDPTLYPLLAGCPTGLEPSLLFSLLLDGEEQRKLDCLWAAKPETLTVRQR